MIVTYNGITLDLCQLRGWERQVEMDGPQYLWTRHRIRVSGVYNPRATSYTRNANTLAPQFTRDTPATITDAVVRHALATPRKQLSIIVGGTAVLFTPNVGQTTDAHNGPTPTVHAVVESIGVKTYLVDWSIECCIVETTGTTPAVLSHRWTMEDHVAMPNYLTTRVIQGKATFRTDLMGVLGRVPDDFRRAFIHPVSLNMQRESIDVTVYDDNSGAEYTLVDQEQAINLTPEAVRLGVTKIEAYHTAEIGKPGTEDVLVGLGGAFMRAGGQLVQANIAGIDPVTTIFANAAAVGVGGLDIGITAASLIPRKTHSIVARVWGHRLSAKVALERVALRVCFFRFALTQLSERHGTVWLQITHDLMGKWVEVQLKVKQGLDRLDGAVAGNIGSGLIRDIRNASPLPGAGAINGFIDNLAAVQRDIMPQGEDVGNDITINDTVAPGPTNQAGLTGRGSFIGKLLAQVLHDPNAYQTAPPTPGPGRNLDII